MNTLKRPTSTRRGPTEARKIPVRFDPSTNGTYIVRFEDNAAEAGFAALLQSGSFHSYRNGFVISNAQKAFLDEQKIPYKMMRPSK